MYVGVSGGRCGGLREEVEEGVGADEGGGVDAGEAEVEHSSDEGFGTGLEAWWGTGEEPGEVVVWCVGFVFFGVCGEELLAAEDLRFEEFAVAMGVDFVGDCDYRS